MIKKQQAAEYIPSRYTHLSNIYSQSQFYEIQQLLQHLASSCNLNTKYPILKLLRAVCRCLLINELQSIFFAYVIYTNGWKINDSIIQKHQKDVKDIVFYTTTDDEYKSLTLYLLLCGYTTKFYLNQCTQIYLGELQKVCPDFKAVFSQWVKQEAHTTLKINPKSLNKVYKQIYLANKTIKSESNLNYNSLVDNILVICPCYNPQKQKQSQVIKQQKTIVKASQPQSLNISTTVLNLPILSSSGFLQQIGIIPFGNSTVVVQNNQTKKPSFLLNSSEYGINNFTFLQQQNDINDLHIGFQQCHSDNQDAISKGGSDLPRDSSKTNRGFSNNSSYFI